jgi:ubiquinone/menaquinone biosynthesis C-methylase UbiE
MKSNPFRGISENVKAVVKPLLASSDEYHITHSARLARTADILVEMINELGDREDIKILELGTSGFIPATLKWIFPGVTIDVTDFNTSAAGGGDALGARKKRLEFSSVAIDVTAYSVDLEYDSIPVDDETYDIVICCEVLEHMEIDPMFMLSEVNRVTKTGGLLLLTTPNILSSRALTKMVEGYAPYFFMQYHKNREYHRHNYEYSTSGVHGILKCAGYYSTVWTEDLFEDSLTSVVDRLNDAGFNIKNVGDNVIARASKVSSVVERYPNGLYV